MLGRFGEGVVLRMALALLVNIEDGGRGAKTKSRNKVA